MIRIETLILAFNIFTFLLFGLDKAMAKKKGFRVPEIVLLLCSFFFGGAGALFGMVVFNHKTSKMKFRIFVPLFFWLNYFMSVDAFSLLKKILSYFLQIMPE